MRERVLWARLYASRGGVTEAALNSDLLPLFERALGGREGRAALTKLLKAQLRARNISEKRAQKSTKYLLTAKGTTAAQNAFPHSKGKSWTAISKTELAAYALGIHDRLSGKEVASLSGERVLQLAIMSSHLALDVPAIPSAAAFEQALLWSGLRRGLSDKVFKWGKGRKPSLATIVAALAASLGDVTPSEKKDIIYKLIAAKAVSASNAKELHDALLARLVSAPKKRTSARKKAKRATATKESNGATRETSNHTAAREKTKHVPSRESTAVSKQDASLTTFAQRVLSAARRSESGKLDSSLILINHAYDQFRRDYPTDGYSLAEFKQQLWACGLAGALRLANADMPQFLDPEDYAKSRFEQGASVFSLIRI